jgi:hypothetical protein
MYNLDQLKEDALAFLQARREVKRKVIIAAKFKKDHRRDLEVELELKLQDMGFHLGLPPTHPQTIMAVAYSSALDTERASKKVKADDGDDDHTPNYPSTLGGHDW